VEVSFSSDGCAFSLFLLEQIHLFIALGRLLVVYLPLNHIGVLIRYEEDILGFVVDKSIYHLDSLTFIQRSP